MSNNAIRDLFYETLKTGLKQSDGKLKWLILQPNIQLSDEARGIYDRKTYIRVSLIPAPTETGTLSGDHKRFTGIYQMDAFILLDVDASDSVPVGDDIIEEIQKIFTVDMLLTDTNGFEVQVISPLKATDAKQVGGRWVCHLYFNYRADTN